MNCLPLYVCKDVMEYLPTLKLDLVDEILQRDFEELDSILTFMNHDSRFLKYRKTKSGTALSEFGDSLDESLWGSFNFSAFNAKDYIAKAFLSTKIENAKNHEIQIDINATVKDFVTYAVLLRMWQSNKQIYKIHKVLEENFLKFDTIDFPVNIIDRLPYQTFYIEFAEDSKFKEHFDGSFVHVVPYHAGYEIHLVRLTPDTEFMSGIFVLEPGDDGFVIFDKHVDAACDHTSDTVVDWEDFGMFTLNSLLYLCAANSEVTESEVTKRTYKPSKTIKNKFSEVRQYECGFVYGKSVRLHRQKMTSGEITKTRGQGKAGVPKRPHTRRAHWHHYRVGPGKKEVILKWVAPMYIRKDEECIATKHRVLK